MLSAIFFEYDFNLSQVLVCHFRNLLSYVFPTLLIVLAASMLSLKGLKDQGRLGRSFGKVTIRDQPPSNTIQKIIAVKDAMRDVENYLQNINVTLLKIRTIILSGQPQVFCCDLCDISKFFTSPFFLSFFFFIFLLFHFGIYVPYLKICKSDKRFPYRAVVDD